VIKLVQNEAARPTSLTWALAPQPIWGYRGPLTTGGIESLRDGEFRKYRASFRMEIGNEGWNFAAGDPYTTALDFLTGANNAGLNNGGPNGTPQRLGGTALAMKLNNLLTRQFRIGCMFDQSPLQENRVTLDLDATGKPNHTDGLGLPRPKVEYGLDPYTMEGFRMAAVVCSQVYQQLGAQEFTRNGVGRTGDFTYRGQNYHYYGAGHVVAQWTSGPLAWVAMHAFNGPAANASRDRFESDSLGGLGAAGSFEIPVQVMPDQPYLLDFNRMDVHGHIDGAQQGAEHQQRRGEQQWIEDEQQRR